MIKRVLFVFGYLRLKLLCTRQTRIYCSSFAVPSLVPFLIFAIFPYLKGERLISLKSHLYLSERKFSLARFMSCASSVPAFTMLFITSSRGSAMKNV